MLNNWDKLYAENVIVLEECDANELDPDMSQIRILSAGESPKNLIIHIHGGGFISMSSASHQNYSRIWAKELSNAILCSIDYRLAPLSKFPS